mmetsp:Transcript_25955/g.38602  ORF Transcript_25955/g.38602 Transcript_25955/m.38602 type:complete len:85 (-) Transcript_25955:764-1018(-)
MLRVQSLQVITVPSASFSFLLFSWQTEDIFGVVNRDYCLYVYRWKKKTIWLSKKGKMIMPDGSVAKDDTTVPKISFVSCGGCHV